MHVYVHHTVVQRGHEPPPTGFEPATSAGLGAPSTPQPPVPFALLWLGTPPPRTLFICLFPHRLPVAPQDLQYILHLV